jgi:transposase-like protein
MTKGNSYKRYPAQFKRMALAKAAESGMTTAKVCQELDVSTRQLRRKERPGQASFAKDRDRKTETGIICR